MRPSFSIPAAYLRKTRGSHPALFDANVNGWPERDDRRFFIRALRGADEETGVTRAWLSDGYKKIDHIDTLMAVFDGIRRAGHPVQIETCDLTDRRMYVRSRCEAVQVLAPGLLAGYRSPFTEAAGADKPMVFAGFVVTNSETGCGACTVTPRIIAQVCSNGMTITRDAMHAVHLGERMDEGIRRSSDTGRLAEEGDGPGRGAPVQVKLAVRATGSRQRPGREPRSGSGRHRLRAKTRL